MQSSIVTIQITGHSNVNYRSHSPTMLERARRTHTSPSKVRYNATAPRNQQMNFTAGIGHAKQSDLQELFPPPLMYIPVSNTPDLSPLPSARRQMPARGPRVPPADISRVNFRIAPSQPPDHPGVRSSDPLPKKPTPTPTSSNPSPRCRTPSSEPPDRDDQSPQYYYRYYPFTDMSKLDKRNLMAEPRSHPIITSTKEGQQDKLPPRWSSADDSLRPTAYHLAELSLHYRGHIGPPVKIVTLKRDEIKSAPPANLRENNWAETLPENTSTRSSSASFKKRSKSNPKDVLNISASNRLLHVMSIDECHVQQRSPVKRVRSAKTPISSAAKSDINSQRREKLRSASQASQTLSEKLPAHMGHFSSGQIMVDSMPSEQLKYRSSSSVAQKVDMPQTKSEKRAQQEKENAIKAAKHFHQRNNVLREQMAVYMQWKTSERERERYNLARGIKSASPTILRSRKEQRLSLFSAVLQQKEKEYAESMYEHDRNVDDEDDEFDDDIAENIEDSYVIDGSKNASGDPENLEEVYDIETMSPTPRGASNKLTEMWSVLE